jgi:hypothetical protein
MTHSKPRNMLSFIYNTTGIGGYRTEMHADMRLAFERFELMDGSAQAACFRIEKAAYDMREASRDAEAKQPIDLPRYVRAETEMKLASQELFKQLSIELTNMVIDGAPQPLSGWPSEQLSGLRLLERRGDKLTIVPTSRTLLLDYVYWLVHFPQLRAALLDPAHGIDKVLTQLCGDADSVQAIKQSLNTITAQLDAPKGPATYSDVRAQVNTLCEALALEYSSQGWLVCW